MGNMARIKEKQPNYLQKFWAFGKRVVKEILSHFEQYLVILALSFFLIALKVDFMGIIAIMVLFVLYGSLSYSEGFKRGNIIVQKIYSEILNEIEKKVMALPINMNEFLGHIDHKDKKGLAN
jgi:Ca2+/Na+ antiporter